MKKNRNISLNECYAILQIPKNSNLDDVKKAYRKRAFELHPDLNPKDPTASKQFQILNEAYVALSQMMQKEEDARKSAKKADFKEHTTYNDTHKKQSSTQQAYKKERSYDSQESVKREEEARRRQEARRQEAEKEARDRKRKEEIRKEEMRKEEMRKEEAKIKDDIRKRSEEQKQRQASAAYAREDVLRDLLHDPFARRVFEDIYSEVSKQSNENNSSKTTTEYNDQSTTSGQKEVIRPQESTEEIKKDKVTPPTIEVDLADSKKNLHVTNSLSSKIFGWFKHQIDEEQTIKMPASTLFSGSRIRLQIRRGLSEELSTVEIVLPKDFIVGKPVRLRGLGKKVGKWQGDLYLTIESK